MTPGINTLLLSTGALGSFTCSGMTLLIYMGPTALRGIRATGDTLSNVESQVFTPYKFGSTAGDRTPDLLTTRPTCYHSATALKTSTLTMAMNNSSQPPKSFINQSKFNHCINTSETYCTYYLNLAHAVFTICGYIKLYLLFNGAILGLVSNVCPCFGVRSCI